jgi:hypothetical protein
VSSHRRCRATDYAEYLHVFAHPFVTCHHTKSVSIVPSASLLHENPTMSGHFRSHIVLRGIMAPRVAVLRKTCLRLCTYGRNILHLMQEPFNRSTALNGEALALLYYVLL